MRQPIPLSALQPGECGQIDQLIGRHEDVHRLQELGLRLGTSVEMVQSGVPCIVKLGGTKLCFRGCDATSVLVRLGEVA